MGIEWDLKNFASASLGCGTPGSVHFKSSEQDQYDHHTCISKGATVWEDMQPVDGTATTAESTCSNNFAHEITKVFNLSGSY